MAPKEDNSLKSDCGQNIEKKLAQRPWTRGDYAKQSWKIWLHSIAPYVGRITPSFAHWLVEICSKKGERVLDPFCGIGTIPLEADLLGRVPIGSDLHPYAIAIAKAKFFRKPLNYHLKWLNSVELETDGIDLETVSPYVRKFYHELTLKELLALRDEILKTKNDFLLGCLLGISHGHRPQHLSMKTGYIIPYDSRESRIYKPVVQRLLQKVKRMYLDPFPLETAGKIEQCDARNLKQFINPSSMDVVISSPPYESTLDYVNANKLRLEILGYSDADHAQLSSLLIQNKKAYLQNMEMVGKEIARVLTDHGLCIFVLGDVVSGKKRLNTAKKISELYETLNFETLCIVTDEIPRSKSTIPKYGGTRRIEAKRNKRDRILVMQNH